MIVITHRIVIREKLEIRGIPFQNVVEAHSGRALPGSLVVKPGSLWFSICTCPHRHLYPWEKIGFAPARIRSRRISNVAVLLLPHLVKAVNGTRSVGVIGKCLGG